MLKGKTVLVTGSAKNLGAAIALSLVKKGAILIVHYNTSKKKAEETFSDVKRYSPKSILVQADLMNIEDVERVFYTIKQHFGKLDILVNCIGDFVWKRISETTEKEIEHVFRNNVTTAFSTMRNALQMMRRQKYGRIINFGCAGCERIIPREMTSPYYAAKTSLYILSKALAASEAKHGITINMISPGVIKTSMAKPEKREMPMKRYANYEDIINAVMFLLDEKSEYITGANIEVSGGWMPE